LPDVVEVRADNNWNVYLNSAFDFHTEAAIWLAGSNRFAMPTSTGGLKKTPSTSTATVYRLRRLRSQSERRADSRDPSPRGRSLVCESKRRRLQHVVCGSHVAPNPDGAPPGALVQTENGIGGTAYLEYRPSTDWDNTDDNGIARLPLPLWTLTAIESDDGLCDASGANCIGDAGASHSVRSEFRYRGGLYDHRSREFRGFAAVERRDAEGNLTTTRFHQDSVRRGKVEVAERFAADPVDPYLRPIDQQSSSGAASTRRRRRWLSERPDRRTAVGGQRRRPDGGVLELQYRRRAVDCDDALRLAALRR
jgi:hypothetical protein